MYANEGPKASFGRSPKEIAVNPARFTCSGLQSGLDIGLLAGSTNTRQHQPVTMTVTIWRCANWGEPYEQV
jgi:hypothetical protein